MRPRAANKSAFLGDSFQLAGQRVLGGRSQSARNLGVALRMIGTMKRFPCRREIYGAGEPAKYFYQILYGAVRVYNSLDDGRRQVSGFYFTGDVFGLEDNVDHQFSAETITASSILIIKRKVLIALAARHSDLANGLRMLTARELAHVRNLMITLGRKNAQERVAAFLLEMSRRLCNNRTLDLPMGRQDIADYLGLTIETVSRIFTQLENESTIERPSWRRVVLRDHNALSKLDR